MTLRNYYPVNFGFKLPRLAHEVLRDDEPCCGPARRCEVCDVCAHDDDVAEWQRDEAGRQVASGAYCPRHVPQGWERVT